VERVTASITLVAVNLVFIAKVAFGEALLQRQTAGMFWLQASLPVATRVGLAPGGPRLRDLGAVVHSV
jgi:hypothetical protein